MSISFQLTSTDFRGVVNRRFWANFLPFPATNQFYFDVGTPNFKLPDVTHDREVELREYREKTPLILAFTRIFTEKQYCPFCYPHLLELSDRYEEFRAIGFEVLLVTSTDRAASQQVARDLNLKMPLLSDPSCKVFRTYEVGQALGAPLPAQFVLDRDGKLRYRHLFSFLEPNAPFDRLLEVARPWGTPAKAPEQADTSPAQTNATDANEAARPTNEPPRSTHPEPGPESSALAIRPDEAPIEIVEPKVEPMPPRLPEGVFAAEAIDESKLETVEPKVEPAPSAIRAIVPLKRRQPWLDEETEATAIDGEIVRDRGDRQNRPRRPQRPRRPR